MPTDPRYKIYPPDMVAKCRATLEPRAGHPLTDKECQESINNLVGFLQVLNDWAKEEKRKKAKKRALSQTQSDDLGKGTKPPTAP